MLEKSRIALPSGFVRPIAFKTAATTSETTTPIRIGIILNIPFPQMLNTIMVPSAIRAISQLVDAFENADGARDRPIQMIIIGPVTTRRQIMHNAMYTCKLDQPRASTTDTTNQLQQYRHRHKAAFLPWSCLRKFRCSELLPSGKPPRNAKDEPRKAGTFRLGSTGEKNRVPRPAQIRVT